MKLIPLPAFQDNDLWVLHDVRRALVAAPGDAQPVLACLQRDRLQLEAILVTRPGPAQTGRRGDGLIRYSERCEEQRARDPLLPGPATGRRWRIDPFLRRRHGAVPQVARAPASATLPDDVAIPATLGP